MTPLKLLSFQQYGMHCSDFSVLSTVTDKIYNELSKNLGKDFFLLNKPKIQNNEKSKKLKLSEFFEVCMLQVKGVNYGHVLCKYLYTAETCVRSHISSTYDLNVDDF